MMLNDSLEKMLAALELHSSGVRALATEDAGHAYSAGMVVPDALTWCVDRCDEHGLRGEDRGLFAQTFVDHLVTLVAMEVA